MRKRNVHIQFWLNRKEAESLDKKVRRSGLSREAYLRHLIDGVVPQDAPPPGLLFHDAGTARDCQQPKPDRAEGSHIECS
jgi:hypothetical protein